MYFTLQRVQRICHDLESLIRQNPVMVNTLQWQKGFFMKPADADGGSWQPYLAGDRWGSYDGHAWFRADVTIPADHAGCRVILDVSVDKENWFSDSRQFLLFVDGQLRQGMDINHRRSVLSEQATPGTVYRIDLQAYAGLVEKPTELYLQLMTEDEAVKKLYYDLHVPCQVAGGLPEGSKTRLDILDRLNQAVNLIDMRKPGSEAFYRSLELASAFLETHFYAELCGHEDYTAVSVGHTHIDVAWLWTLAQTRQKTARSFSTVLRMMEEHPEYVFMSSQPQLYQFLKQDYPDLYEKVRARVREGRWEAEGGMWLEADCNLTSGESLVRQLLHGHRFFLEEFGVESRILWLPDVFGYSGALPQILKKSGIDYFMTTKINWNQYNPIPADSFYWEGIDGSQVLTHFITTTSEDYNPTPHFSTYNGFLTPRAVMGGWNRYQEKQIHEEILVSYGYGDGGGGPTDDMIERGKRMARGIPGCPRVVMGPSRPFFERLEQQVEGNPWLKKWVGELYFEYHRGTYTSMARNKRDNRKSELLYQDAESLAALAELVKPGTYPATELYQGWETILLNQFHDILPGSSIEAVYEDSARDYARVLREGHRMASQALDNISAQIKLDQPSIVVANTAGYERSELVTLPWPSSEAMPVLCDPELAEVIPVQKTADGLIFSAPNVPAKGYRSYPIQADSAACGDDSKAMCTTLLAQADCLENRYFRIELDPQGHLTRIFDRANHREVLKAGARGNVLRAFEDKPIAHQNWDIDIYYQQKNWILEDVTRIEVIESGPVRAALRIERPFLDSTIVQKIMIYDQIPRIDFDTWIDWKENEILLKAEFPVDIHAETATYDIQFGNVTRSTHWNTSWDWARFEVCAQKWADLSEDGYGVSLLNESKYGHDIRENTMRLTLIKSGMSPNPHADREQHHFVYSLYPHAGGWREAGTMQQAYSMNIPLYARLQGISEQGALPADFSLCRVDRDDHVMLETVKRAEDGNGLIIRLFEFSNRRGPVQLTLAGIIDRAEVCDLMERPLAQPEAIMVDGSSISFAITPYEIKTFRVAMKI